MAIFNISTRKVGGLRFIKIGRLTLSWSISRKFKPLPTAEEALSRRARTIELKRWRRESELTAQLWANSEWASPVLRYINHDPLEHNL